jgi:hypothetical protein
LETRLHSYNGNFLTSIRKNWANRPLHNFSRGLAEELLRIPSSITTLRLRIQ